MAEVRLNKTIMAKLNNDHSGTFAFYEIYMEFLGNFNVYNYALKYSFRLMKNLGKINLKWNR